MYDLVIELFGHQGDVRTICSFGEDGGEQVFASGGRDRLLKIWKSQRQGKIFEKVLDVFSHEHWVQAIIELPDGRGFVTGAADHKIRWFSKTGNIICTISGHSNQVASLSFEPTTGHLLSGSWDGTAKEWELRSDGTGHEIRTLGNHENGVCVLGLPNGVIATGSAGHQINNQIVGFQVRLWRDGAVFKTLKHHTGPVRCLCIHPNLQTFFSCSNDGSVCHYTLDGTLLNQFRNPVALDGSTAFCYFVTVNERTGEIITANDDTCIRIWSPDDAVKPVYTIFHPCTVWCVSTLLNGDVVSAGADGVVRVFSRDQARFADEAIRLYFHNEVQKSLEAQRRAAQGTGVSPKYDVNRMQSVDLAPSGTRDGEVKMFNNNGKAWVYSWSQVSGMWIEIGEAIGPAENEEDNMIDGRKYDKVLPIEVEDPQSGGLKKLKLGINNADNPFVVAYEFCAINMLPENYVQQIVDYINQNRGKTSSAVIEMTTDQNGSPQADQSVHQLKPTLFPLSHKTGYIFEAGDLDKIFDKIKEFNSVIPNSTSKLTPIEISTIESLCVVLGDTTRYHSSIISTGHVSVLEKAINSWDEQHVFPIFDLLRLVFLHPEGVKSFGEARLGKVLRVIMRVVQQACDKSSSIFDEKLQLQIVLTSSRVFCNLFKTGTGVDYITSILSSADNVDSILLPVRYMTALDNKFARLSIATLCLNIANSFYHVSNGSSTLGDVHALVLSLLLDRDNGLMNKCAKEKEIESIRRGLLALGTVLYTKLMGKSTGIGNNDEDLKYAKMLEKLLKSLEKVEGVDLKLINEVGLVL